MSQDEIRRRVRQEFEKEFAACDRLDEAMREILRTNHRGLGPGFRSFRQLAIAALFAKACKSFNAIRMLAEEGYGEDSFLIVRSLVNLSIDLAFIRQDDSDERALNWFFAGGVEARTLLERIGDKPKGASHDIQKRAKAWRSISIRRRAKIAGATTFYELGYHHGSSYEHSDSSSIVSYMILRERGIEFFPWPNARLVGHSLKSAFVVFSAVLNEWALEFGIESNWFGELYELGHELVKTEPHADNADREGSHEA